ncbi:MAG TPA: rhomboid family intramembrane serine protease [Stackebrandtia sp.]|uniref:rhomboid family intramembrane serine protease n=1 Tax=Stackebrandtia sp. TaxID=2023065 RepID=UPI002D6731D7|nr:rhomboid family intramembrane serine protease [Stackebrandtia sp.]HZE38404.1 rhomboid family intramembrane serine protease [Stackebrandtia sp.]
MSLPQAFRAAAVVAAGVAALWIIAAADHVLSGSFDRYGIAPRTWSGLLGIPAAPLLHTGYAHLAANTVPLLVLGFLAAARGLRRFVAAVCLIVLVSGAGVWVTAPAGSVTVGASGVIFGLFGYLVGRGVFDRRGVDIALAVLVVVYYGSILWGVLPSQPHVSWQGHLFGLIGGVLAAWLLRAATLRPRSAL